MIIISKVYFKKDSCKPLQYILDDFISLNAKLNDYILLYVPLEWVPSCLEAAMYSETSTLDYYIYMSRIIEFQYKGVNIVSILTGLSISILDESRLIFKVINQTSIDTRDIIIEHLKQVLENKYLIVDKNHRHQSDVVSSATVYYAVANKSFSFDVIHLICISAIGVCTISLNKDEHETFYTRDDYFSINEN